MLTEQTRYRVTGAVFLFALTVIFLPMLFDGGGIEPLDLPSVPHTQMSAPTYPEAPDMSQTVSGRDRLLAEIDSEGFSRSTGTRIGEPVLNVDDDNPDAVVAAWAVQLASFAKRENAVALRDQLLTTQKLYQNTAFLNHNLRTGSPDACAISQNTPRSAG